MEIIMEVDRKEMQETLLRAITDICSQLSDFVLNNTSETALWPLL
jgi:hypothetical protein